MTDSDDTFGECVLSVLAHRRAASDLLERQLRARPGHVPALALRGFGLRKLGRRDVWGALDGVLARMEPADDRDRALARALAAWRDDDGPRAAAILDARLDVAPRDALLAKLAHGLRFVNGDPAGMRASIERVLPAFERDAPERPYLEGCHCFALEETGEYAEAERVGRAAVERAPADVWGAHAVAHVLFMRGRHEEGARWLAAYAPRLEGCTNLAGHVVWHEALFLVELGRAADALALFDEGVAGWLDEDYRDLSNGTSLLFRLDRCGVDVGDRWARYADLARARLGDHGSAFADLHYVLALAGAGELDRAREFVRSMARREGDGFDATVLREVGLPLACAVVDLFEGRARAAAIALDRPFAETLRLGGSHAQRRLLDWLREAALADAGMVEART